MSVRAPVALTTASASRHASAALPGANSRQVSRMHCDRSSCNPAISSAPTRRIRCSLMSRCIARAQSALVIFKWSVSNERLTFAPTEAAALVKRRTSNSLSRFSTRRCLTCSATTSRRRCPCVRIWAYSSSRPFERSSGSCQDAHEVAASALNWRHIFSAKLSSRMGRTRLKLLRPVRTARFSSRALATTYTDGSVRLASSVALHASPLPLPASSM